MHSPAPPEGEAGLPGVLHVHGGGQTVNARWLRFWTDRGYAALTFNWGGAWPGRDKFTDWGTLTQGNHKDAGARAMATEPSVRDASWYLWTRISRRALTCVEEMEQVDPDRLSVFGVSMGGTIVWPMAAMDDRIKAACAIYGVGWNTYPDEIDVPDPKAGDAGVAAWRRAMEPESYAPLVRCPVLFLDATNDQHGKMDWAYHTLALVPAEVRWAFTPRCRHHIAAEQGADLPLWMDAHLKGGEPFPEPPVAEVRLGSDGVPRMVVEPDGSRSIRRVDLFYAIENRNPKNRYWRPAGGQSGRRDLGRRASHPRPATAPLRLRQRPLRLGRLPEHESGLGGPRRAWRRRGDRSALPPDRRLRRRDRRLGDEFARHRPDPAGALPAHGCGGTGRDAGDHRDEAHRPGDAQAGRSEVAWPRGGQAPVPDPCPGTEDVACRDAQGRVRRRLDPVRHRGRPGAGRRLEDDHPPRRGVHDGRGGASGGLGRRAVIGVEDGGRGRRGADLRGVPLGAGALRQGRTRWSSVSPSPTAAETDGDERCEVIMARHRLILLLAVLSLELPCRAGDEPGQTLRVVVFGGHPDDPESGAGGLIATLTRQGHEVILAYGTAFRGDRRFFDRPEDEVRREEAAAACTVLGASPKVFPYAHESLAADEATLRAVSSWLDEVGPDIVVTHWPLDTHPNHHVVSSLVWQCYLRQGGWNLYFFEVMTDQQTIAFRPEPYLDIAPVRGVKRRALMEHRSQEPEAIWKAHEAMHRRRGAECGVEFAEAYSLVEAKEGCPLLPVEFLGREGGGPAATTDRPDGPASISEAARDDHGILVHAVESPYQAGETEIRVLLPDRRGAGRRYPVVYVLPVEAGTEDRYGDGLLEVRRHDLHNELGAIFVAPTFSHLPWYADHPTDPEIRQETYFLEVVVPFVESRYPARADPEGRLLLGFSKSGWGAWSLLLRHPEVFGRAAAWDAPLMLDQPGRYGSGDIFGTQANFEGYRITTLLGRHAAELRDHERLILLGYGNFRGEHERIHDILVDLGIPHAYEDGPQREHSWGSGWVPEAARALLRDEEIGD